MMPPRLPDPVEDVAIPDLFAATAIASAGKCRLRLALAVAQQRNWAIPAGPQAELGTLGHLVPSQHAREGGEPSAVFDQCAAESGAALARNPRTAVYADLARVIGDEEWSRFRAATLARCTSATRRIPESSSSRDATPFGREKPMESSRLRLKGRPDLLRRVEGGVEVRDYKTGQVHSADGAIREEIKLQLWLYGLLALEYFSGAEVRLLVDAGAEHEVAFGAPERKKARRALAAVKRGLAAGSTKRAEALAAPGDCCANCPFRTRCVVYLGLAPTWWSGAAESPRELARDCWGELREIRPDPWGSQTLLMQDAAGRKVRIDRVDLRHGDLADLIGHRLWLFELESNARRRTHDGARIQPMTFHELPADTTHERAWRLEIFR